MSQSRKTRRSLAALALGAGLLLAGCAAPGQVKNYNADTHDNFVDKCIEANQSKTTDPRPLCECWYQKITESMSFDEFKKLDSALKQAVKNNEIKSNDDLKNRFPQYYDLIKNNCGGSGPTSSPTTTTTAG